MPRYIGGGICQNAIVDCLQKRVMYAVSDSSHTVAYPYERPSVIFLKTCIVRPDPV